MYQKLVGLKSLNLKDARVNIGSNVSISHETDNQYSKKAIVVKYYNNIIGYIGEKDNDEAHSLIFSRLPITGVIKTLRRKGEENEYTEGFEISSINHIGIEIPISEDGVRDEEGFYHKDGKKYKSITTLLKKFPSDSENLIAWAIGKAEQNNKEGEALFDTYKRVLEDTAKAGTALHAGIEDVLNGIREPKEGSAMHNFIAKFNPKVVALEEVVYDNDLMLAGRYDALLEIGGKKVLIDWKSSSSYQHKQGVQGAFYAVNNKEDVDEVWVVRFYLNNPKQKPKQGYSIKKITESEYLHLYNDILCPLTGVIENIDTL